MRKRLAFTFAALLASCLPSPAATMLTGAGSTWDFPFFSKAFYEYGKIHSDVQVNYQSIGSGGGIRQFTLRTVDFGATDVPMNDKEIAGAEAGGNGPVLQVPIVLGGVSVAYNLPGVSSLKLTPGVLADIYLGKTATWNDPAIAKINPGVKLPGTAIVVVHRSDGSGTTYIFTDYLSHVSPEWKAKVGTGKSVTWPAPSAVGGKGNEGVAGQVTNSPGAIGYVELAYVVQNRMPAVTLQNAAGKWIADGPAGVRAAAATRPDVSPAAFSIVDAKCAACYPIAGYSWAVLYGSPADKARAKTLQDLFRWVSSPAGQKIAASLYYVPLPANVRALAQRTLAKMKV